MATRKKVLKPKKDEAKEEKAQAVVTQVVEVVGDAVDSIPKEEVKEVVDELKEEVSDVSEKVEELEEKVEPEQALGEPKQVSKKETDKEVIEELFDKRENTVTPELAGYKDRGSKSMVLWVVIVIGVALLTGFGLLVLVQGPSSLTSFFASPTPTPTSTPTPTPTPEVANRSALTIEVLNGSGKAGAAGVMRKFLEEKGYTVDSVGNADRSNFEQTEIHVKEDKEDYLSLLKEDLSESYTVSTAAADLAPEAEVDAQVIVGLE